MTLHRNPIEPAAGLSPSVRAFRAVLMLAQRLHYLMDDRLRADGLTTRQAALLTAVGALGRPSLTEVAAVLATTHQNAAQLVAALERKGLLRTEPDPGDRRRRLLVTTETNQRYWQERDAADHAAVAGWFAGLSDEETETLYALSARLLADLGGPWVDPPSRTAAGQPAGHHSVGGSAGRPGPDRR